jgi:hypothetical protein
MRMWTFRWNLLLCMAAIATAFLVTPPVAKAQMIPSQMQSERALALVRQQLRSELMQQQIQRFGLSEGEARQIQMVLSDEQVIREMCRLETQLACASKKIIEKNTMCRLLRTLESAAQRHVDQDLQERLSERAERAFGSERLVTSRLSDGRATMMANHALTEVRRALTTERLVALGMTQNDAAMTAAKLNDSDISAIMRDGIQVDYAGKWQLTGAGIMVVVCVLLIVALAATGGGEPVILLIGITVAIAFVGWLFGAWHE